MARRRNKKKNQEQEETLINIYDARDQAQSYMDRNQNLIFGALVGLVLIIGGYLAYKYIYKAPKEEKAMEQMFQAEYMFRRDSFAKALTGPGGSNPGFINIIKEYSGTKAGNLANYYAGASYLQMGEYQGAIDYLKEYDESDGVTSIHKYGMMADAYSELGDFDKAISLYKKATNLSKNEFSTPYYMQKLGLLYEKQSNTAEAKKMFQRLKEEYPKTSFGQDADKFLSRLGE